MADDTDYKLIYEARKADLYITSKDNYVARAVNAARTKAETEFAAMTKKLSKLLGTDDFTVTNVACMADGISSHVYSPHNGVAPGLGRRKCVFCGCDDFDGY